jgi:hypothetical protein
MTDVHVLVIAILAVALVRAYLELCDRVRG